MLGETPSGLTLQLHVGDIVAARRFYTAALGGPPRFEPHEDFLEWRVGPGETWLQVVGVPDGARPLPTRLRFRVTDLAAAHAAARAGGLNPSPPTTLPGIVRFFDLTDPWDNQLGCYEDLFDVGAAEGPPPVAGASVHDESQFVVDEP